MKNICTFKYFLSANIFFSLIQRHHFFLFTWRKIFVKWTIFGVVGLVREEFCDRFGAFYMVGFFQIFIRSRIVGHFHWNPPGLCCFEILECVCGGITEAVHPVVLANLPISFLTVSEVRRIHERSSMRARGDATEGDRRVSKGTSKSNEKIVPSPETRRDELPPRRVSFATRIYEGFSPRAETRDAQGRVAEGASRIVRVVRIERSFTLVCMFQY